MARLWTSGAEIGNVVGEGMVQVGGGLSADTSVVRTGTYSYQAAATGTAQANYATRLISGALGTTYYARCYFTPDALPNVLATVLFFLTPANAQTGAVKITTGGALQLFAGGTKIGSDSAALTAGTTYRVELSCTIDTGSTDGWELRLDGTTVASTAGVSFSDTPPDRLGFGWLETTLSSGKSCHFDDVAINDSTGTDQNSWPGEGKILNSLATADSARATLWTGGALGTTNLFDAVNTVPPNGKAAETDLTQIEHAGGAAGTTDAYDATMQSYTAAGVGASDTITLVQPVLAHAEDLTTGIKLLTFSVESNPAIAAVANFAAGSDVGALSTFPINWTTTPGNIAYAPSVTLGTAPVMRVTRPETATRVASVCYMALVVEYVPAAAAEEITRPMLLVRAPFPYRAVG